MTKAERHDLTQLIKKRERVMKSQAQERSAALLAEFDAQSAKIHSYDDDAVWAEATRAAEVAIAEANTKVAERCRELGIPVEFAPRLGFYWEGRGHNAAASRRQELRQAAKSRIEAIEKEAATKIERMSLEAQTQVIARGLESDAAKTFLNTMPSLDALMPPVAIGEIQALVDAKRQERKRLGYTDYYN